MNTAVETLVGPLDIRHLAREEYVPLWRAMQTYTDDRDASSRDAIWFTEHPPVFTMGLNASPDHLLAPGNIPVVNIDRGGQVTYHGPGKLMIYPLIDIRRAGIGVRKLVTALEQSVVDFVAEFDISAAARADAPGVYVDNKKLASVGLRIRRGASFHGMALNVDVDMEPFSRINPCGYRGLEMTDLKRLGVDLSLRESAEKLLPHFLRHLGLPPAI